MDKALAFFVEHYPDIRAVLELQDYAETKLPNEVVKVLYGCAKNECRAWPWGFERADIRPWKDDRGLGWYDDYWVSEEGEGVYFGAHNFTLSSLIDSDGDDKPFLYLYRDVGRFGSLTAAGLKVAIAAIRPTLKLAGISFDDEEKKGVYLVKQSLGDIVTIDALQNLDAMCNKFLEQARRFTEALAPTVYRTAKQVT